MAPSQVEFASSLPFGGVRWDQNRCRDQNPNVIMKPKSNFQRNLKELVRDHLQFCISISPRSSDLVSNENSNQHGNGFSCWGCNNAKNKDRDEKSVLPMSKRRSQVLDRWAAQQVRRTMTEIEGKSQDPIPVLDRWAARQARERITAIERKSHKPMPVLDRSPSQKARETMTEIERKSPEPMPVSSTFVRDHSPAPSDSSSVDVKVASLVQKLRSYEKEDNKQNKQNETNTNGMVGSRASSVSATSIDDVCSVEACETTTTTGDDKSGANLCYNNETESESVGDRESDRTTHSCDQISLSSDADGMEGVSLDGERERMRVVDIIRKWTSVTQAKRGIGSNENERGQQQPMVLPQLAQLRAVLEQGGDRRGGSPVGHSPRLRGRQAIIELFMRVERERHKEIEGLAARQAVSKFSQRGRIQATLRLRFLRQDRLAEDQQCLLHRASGLVRLQHKSSLINQRERLTEAFEPDNAAKKSLPTDISKCNLAEKASTSKEQIKEFIHHEQNSSEEINFVDETHPEKDDHEEIHQEETNHEETNHEEMKHEVVDHKEVSNEKTNHENADSREQTKKQPCNSTSADDSLLCASEDRQVEHIPPSGVMWQDTSCETCNTVCQGSSSYVETSYNDDWEEELIYDERQDYDEQYSEANLDWISDISRPRSYWEGLRQAWYKEISESPSAKEDIRQLIERSCVSDALSSAFRERMDQLLMSCRRRQMHASENEDEDPSMSRTESLGIQEEEQNESQLYEREREDEEQEFLKALQHEDKREEEQRGRVDDEHAQEADDERTPHPESYQDGIGDYFGQTPHPSPQTPWSHYHEGSDDSGRIESTPFQQSPIINSDHDTHEDSSFKNISSIEMELIYDLKAHMEQLYREMAELRQSLKSCMDMQMNMKNFVREEISAALRYSDREEKKVGGKKMRKKGNCSICNEKKVDTLLYRKCSVCRLEIADVVRAYPDA
ncbi:hypothetical protein Droror1_Dr00018091 [Drosera rotundifolia]